MNTTIKMFQKGMVAKIAGQVMEKLMFTNDQGRVYYVLKVGTQSRPISILMNSPEDLDNAPPVGTEIRGEARIDRASNSFAGAVIRGSNFIFATPNSEGWNPLSDAELADGLKFEAMCKISNKESYYHKQDRKERYNVDIAVWGETFSFRNISRELYDQVTKGMLVMAFGVLESPLCVGEGNTGPNDIVLQGWQIVETKQNDDDTRTTI